MSAQNCRIFRLALATTAALATLPAMAAGPCNAYNYPCADEVMSAAPALTTAAVRQDAQDARKGIQPTEGDSRPGLPYARGMTTRAEVNAELLSAQRARLQRGATGHAEPLAVDFAN